MKNKVGNACRTKNQIRGSKSKGSQLEYDVQHSLLKIYEDIYLTKERGFQKQIDVRSDKYKISIECKRLKAISWNQAKKFLEKLKKVSPTDHKCFLIFQSNQQPCLVMYKDEYIDEGTIIREFESVFGVLFEKHSSTRVKKK